MKKISVKTIYLILVISIGLVGLGVGSTFAMFTASGKIDNPVSFNAGMSSESDILETIEVSLSPKEVKKVNLNVNNNTDYSLNYVMWYIDEGYDVDFGLKRVGTDGYQNVISPLDTHEYEVSIRNNSDSDTVMVIIGVSSSKNNPVLSKNMAMIPQMELSDNVTPLESFEYILGGGTYVNESSMRYSVPSGDIYLINYIGNDTEVIVPSTYMVNGVEYNTVILSSDMDDTNGVFTSNKVITSVFIDENVKLVNFSVGSATMGSADCMFSGCSNLTTVSSLPSVISSAYAMFSGCSNLTGTIDIVSEKISSFSDAFKNTSKSINVILPKSGTKTYSSFMSYTARPSNVTYTIRDN